MGSAVLKLTNPPIPFYATLRIVTTTTINCRHHAFLVSLLVSDPWIKEYISYVSH
ncbi:MAG: hypothetical protein BMS9Abin02_0426 [Anaerolineae bacterium]|nr:MAG: hypothetical protein BMS9Abin02_0426 [Anaerolineae bacterium]